MDDNQEPYWKKHLTGSIQCVFGFYCCVIATLAYFFPRPIPVSKNAVAVSGGSGAAMNATYYMPWYLWLGIVGLGLSVIIPAIFRLAKRAPVVIAEEKAQSPQELRTQIIALAGELTALLFDYEEDPCHEQVYKYAGLGFRGPEQPGIRDTFAAKFKANICTIEERIATLGILHEIEDAFGSRLSIDVLNADDVRELIGTLKDIALVVSRKYIPEAKRPKT